MQLCKWLYKTFFILFNVLLGFGVFAADFTTVCTTELGKMAQYQEEFQKRGAKLLGVSCDDVQSHNERIKDTEAYTVSTGGPRKTISEFYLFIYFKGVICKKGTKFLKIKYDF